MVRGVLLVTRAVRAASHGGTRVSLAADVTSQYVGTAKSPMDASKRTPLYDLHREQDAQWGTFAGYSMPLWYRDSGQIAEHHHCRNSCSIFDVSHMLQLKLYGKDLYKFLDTITISDWETVTLGKCKLSCLLLPSGGVIDDVVFAPAEDHVFTVVNAGCAEKDMEYLQAQKRKLGMDVEIEPLVDRSLIAIQGPKAVEVLRPLLPPNVDFSQWPFMTSMVVPVGGFPCRVTRCGYTGEDGFEVSALNRDIDALARKLLSHPACKLAGLGARDSLRLEAGLSLYGTDMDEHTTPVEAGMKFLLTKAKRQRGGWYGSDVIRKHATEGAPRVKVGIAFPDSKRTPRDGKILCGTTGEEIGMLTSGCRSPTLGYPIGLGLMNTDRAKVGESVRVRGGVGEGL